MLVLLFGSVGFSLSLEYLPRITVYGTINKPIDAQIKIRNPNNFSINLSLVYVGPSEFIGDRYLWLEPNEEINYNFTLIPQKYCQDDYSTSMTINKSCISNGYLYLTVKQNGTSLASFTVSITENVKEDETQVMIVLLSALVATLIIIFILHRIDKFF